MKQCNVLGQRHSDRIARFCAFDKLLFVITHGTTTSRMPRQTGLFK